MGCGVCANGKDVGIGILILDSQGRIAATATQMGGWFLTKQHTIICALVWALRFAKEMSFSSIALGMTSSSLKQDLMNKTRHSVLGHWTYTGVLSLVTTYNLLLNGMLG